MINHKPIIFLILLCVGITACSTVVPAPIQPAIDTEPTTAPEAAPAQEETQIQLPIMGPAPEIQNDIWINSETPLRLADLQGKVVLLEFWTFG